MVDPLTIGRAWARAGEVGPPVDVYETPDSIVIRVAVPGAEATTLSLTIGEDTVTLRGETPAPGSRWGDRTIVHWQEVPYGRFERTVPVPSLVDKDRSRAAYKNGVLEITLPKVRAQAARTVPIDVAPPRS
jgi:HSP20 family protein